MIFRFIHFRTNYIVHDKTCNVYQFPDMIVSLYKYANQFHLHQNMVHTIGLNKSDNFEQNLLF